MRFGEKIMRKILLITCCWLLSVSSLFAQTPGVIAEWEKFWNTYDLDQMEKLFVNSDQLTYFSSEKEGLTRGFDAMIKHHEGFGFVSGGVEKNAKLWLEDIETDYVGDTAVVTAIWFFDVFRDGKQQIMKGPVSFICAKQGDGSYKMLHVHFANY